MLYESIVTSAESGVDAGRTGFCTVLRTRGLHRDVSKALESATGYRHVFPQGDPRNPLIRSHVIMDVAPMGKLSLLTRIVDVGNDYSGRTNKLAHHLVLDAAEVSARARSSPAAMLRQAENGNVFHRQWAGVPQEKPTAPMVPNVAVEPPEQCSAWQQAAGDAGWAGFLVDRALQRQPTWIIVTPGVDVLALFAEAMALVNYPQRWTISFTTYALENCDLLWRAALDGSPEAMAARRQQQVAVVDLVRRPALTARSPMIDAARGTAGVPWKREAARPSAAGPVPNGVGAGHPPSPASTGHAGGVRGPGPVVPAGPMVAGGPPSGPPGMPPPIGGRPPMLDPLGTRSGFGTGGGGQGSADYVPEPVRRGGPGVAVVYGGIGALVVAVLFAIVTFVQPVREVAIRLINPQRPEPVHEQEPRPPEGPPRRSPPEVVAGAKGQPDGDGGGERGKNPKPSDAPAGDTPSVQPPSETPQQPTQSKEKKEKTPQEKWREFQNRLAQPGARYPFESLDGEKPDEQTAKICEVGEFDFDLQLPTAAFVSGNGVWQLACTRSDKEKRAWTFECLSWPEGMPKQTTSRLLGNARVEDDGWLVARLEKGDDTPIVKAARTALACGPLTLISTLDFGPGAGLGETVTWVQLRRPLEFGPLVIEDFFANRAIWPPKGKKDGQPQKAEYVAVPGAAVPWIPFTYLLDVKQPDVKLQGDGGRMPHIVPVGTQEGTLAAINDPCEVQITWQTTFNGVPTNLVRTNLEFQPVSEGNGTVLGVRVDVGDGKLIAECVKYHRLAHLNKAPAENFRESGFDQHYVDEFFPITEKIIKDFRTSQLESVAYATMSRFIQAELPPSYDAHPKRSAAITHVVKAKDLPLAKPLSEWPDALRDYLSETAPYQLWCGPPGPPPQQQSNDPKHIEGLKAEHRAWEGEMAAFQKRIKENRAKTAEFATWLGDNAKDEELRKTADVLQAMCKAIEKLPAVEKTKQEAVDLLASLPTADLELVGTIVAWPGNENQKKCVLAEFKAGKPPLSPAAAQSKVQDKSPKNNRDVLKPKEESGSGPFLDR